jgi:hypothetical protein
MATDEQKEITQETLFGVLRRARSGSITKEEACASVLEIYRMMSEIFMAFVRGASEERANALGAERETCAQIAEKLGATEAAKAIRDRQREVVEAKRAAEAAEPKSRRERGESP